MGVSENHDLDGVVRPDWCDIKSFDSSAVFRSHHLSAAAHFDDDVAGRRW